MYGDDPTSIIVEHDILREAYIPDKLKARETQSEQILCCLSPVRKRHKPIHTWLYGKPGTGKTSTAIHVLRHLEAKNSVKSIVINCWKKDTFYEILDEMISEFRILRADEHRTSFKLEKLRSFFKDHPFIVVLDEVDQVKPRELSSVLYNLDSMLNAGIVCISDSTRALIGLEERVRSRLNPHTIFFPCYTRQILLDILTHRAELALAEGGWSLTALRRIAAMAQGDARVAIRILRRAAVMADHQRMDRITSKTLKEQMKAVKETRKAHVLSSLTKDHRMLFEIVKQKGRILSGDFWEEYLQRCSKLRRRPLASRTFSDYANRLVQAGLMTSERARVRGKVRLFKIVA
ncbi:MAG: AAA family ATPase [Planctomycetes bacterium]|nr:AAA family ATPase [Planctomycetota bacterium]